MSIVVVQADLNLPAHARAVVDLTDAYARDPLGNGAPLSDAVKANLIKGLAQHPTTVVMLAYAETQPIGIATCFLGFSTFAARPLLNLHDLAVLPAFRGRGVGGQLLAAVERCACARGCCKITLEVLENNQRARRVYESNGFARVGYQAAAGAQVVMAKALTG